MWRRNADDRRLRLPRYSNNGVSHEGRSLKNFEGTDAKEVEIRGTQKTATDGVSSHPQWRHRSCGALYQEKADAMKTSLNTGDNLAAPQGFEPRYADPESAVLPLNEGAVASLSNEFR
jgi:hypothetical protein